MSFFSVKKNGIFQKAIFFQKYKTIINEVLMILISNYFIFKKMCSIFVRPLDDFVKRFEIRCIFNMFSKLKFNSNAQPEIQILNELYYTTPYTYFLYTTLV